MDLLFPYIEVQVEETSRDGSLPLCIHLREEEESDEEIRYIAIQMEGIKIIQYPNTYQTSFLNRQ